jgi:hypothetical protein
MVYSRIRNLITDIPSQISEVFVNFGMLHNARNLPTQFSIFSTSGFVGMSSFWTEYAVRLVRYDRARFARAKRPCAVHERHISADVMTSQFGYLFPRPVCLIMAKKWNGRHLKCPKQYPRNIIPLQAKLHSRHAVYQSVAHPGTLHVVISHSTTFCLEWRCRVW